MNHPILKCFKGLVIFCITLHCATSMAQGQGRYWHFGSGAGLDFSTSPPTFVNGVALTTYEGCASISDAFGNLLFYTDGSTVYTFSNTVMANGLGLLGDGSTTQSGIIVKQPGTANLYYIFSLDDVGGPDGLSYSIVDMALSAGTGSVIVKNIPVYTPSCEKLTAVPHCNGTDIWIVSHEFNTNVFRSYLLSATGLSSNSINSACGAVITNSLETIGQMKCSPQSDKLLTAVYGNSLSPTTLAQLFDFDAATGTVSNPITLANTIAYGCEFSSDGSKAYVGLYGNQTILQYNLCAGTASAIVASQYSISCTIGSLGAFQLAADGKIYIASYGASALSSINSPNNSGAACNLALNSVSLQNSSSQLGLPNFMSRYFTPLSSSVQYTGACLSTSFSTSAQVGTVTTLCSTNPNTLQAVSWNFGDLASGPNNTAIGSAVSHTYGTAGTYTVKLILNSSCGMDTVYKSITVPSASNTGLAITGALNICSGEKHVYTASGAVSYYWSTGSSAPTITLSPSATTAYSLTANFGGTCTATKQFTVVVNKCTELEVQHADLVFSEYPNPFSDHINVQVAAPITVELLDQQGCILLKKFCEESDTQLDTHLLGAGLYYLKVGRTYLKLVKLPLRN